MRSTNAIIAEVPGALGQLLREAGFRARLVVEREDGSELSSEDREAIGDSLDAAEERDDKAEREHPLRELVFLRGMRRGDEFDARAEATPKAAAG